MATTTATTPGESKRPATMADLEALPPSVKGEIIDGVLHTQPRPRWRHQRLIRRIGGEIGRRFEDGVSGPGGWWILPEPGIELPGALEVSPDIAGWRLDRIVGLAADAAIKIAPDWACEVLSTSTRSYDFVVKRAFYARVGISHLWYVDVDAHTVFVSRLENGAWVDVGTFAEESAARIAPFDAVELDVAAWWAGIGIG